jgi:hypothetical protein
MRSGNDRLAAAVVQCHLSRTIPWRELGLNASLLDFDAPSLVLAPTCMANTADIA